MTDSAVVADRAADSSATSPAEIRASGGFSPPRYGWKHRPTGRVWRERPWRWYAELIAPTDEQAPENTLGPPLGSGLEVTQRKRCLTRRGAIRAARRMVRGPRDYRVKWILA